MEEVYGWKVRKYNEKCKKTCYIPRIIHVLLLLLLLRLLLLLLVVLLLLLLLSLSLLLLILLVLLLLLYIKKNITSTRIYYLF